MPKLKIGGDFYYIPAGSVFNSPKLLQSFIFF